MSSPSPAAPLVFVHVPKAAGTALRLALARAVDAENVHTCFDGTMLGGHHPGDIANPRMRSRLMIRADDYPDDADLVTGHFSPALTRARYPQARHLTVLREARTRLLSAWLFYRMFSNRNVARWGRAAHLLTAARQPLAVYLTTPQAASRTDNALLRQLLWPHPLVPDSDFIDPAHDEFLLADAMKVLSDLDFVGLVEEPNLPTRLSGWLGAPVEFEQYNHPGTPPRRRRVDVRSHLSEAVDLITARTRLDHALWLATAAEHCPGQEPQALADEAWQRAVGRHAAQQQELPGPSPLVVAADAGWNLTHPWRRHG